MARFPGFGFQSLIHGRVGVRRGWRREPSKASAAGSVSPRAIRAARGARATVREAASAGRCALERGVHADALPENGRGRPFRRERVPRRRPASPPAGPAAPAHPPMAPGEPRRKGSRPRREAAARAGLKGRELKPKQTWGTPHPGPREPRGGTDGRLRRPRPATGFRDSVLTKRPRSRFPGPALRLDGPTSLRCAAASRGGG